MNSIKGYKDEQIDYTLQNIIGQALWYSRCCTLSVSLMSGFGLPWNYDNDDVKQWFRVLKKENVKISIPENITILRGIYKKAEPKYSNAFNENMRDYRNFVWDDSNFEKIITPTSESHLMMDEIMLSKYFSSCSMDGFDKKENLLDKKVLSILLINSAIIQSEFLSSYLRNRDGLFVSKYDLTENPYSEPHLEESDIVPTVSEQAFALKAFSMLSDSLVDENYPLLANSKYSETAKRYAGEIYGMFKDSPSDIIYGKTKDLCNVISSCIQYYKSCMGDEEGLMDYIMLTSLELESRVDMSGNLVRFPGEDSLTSSSSCFLALKTLIEAYRLTGIYKFMNTATLLYKKLNLLWDPSSGLYSLDSDDKYEYTCRDVGSVIGGLNSIRLFGDESIKSDAEQKLIAMFNSAVNSSGIIQSTLPPPPIDDLEGYRNSVRNKSDIVSCKDFCHPDIPKSSDCNIPPVLAKKFTYKPKKHKFSINSSSFYTDYVMYTLSEMFLTNYPEIQYFYSREDSMQL